VRLDSEDTATAWVESHQEIGRHPKTKRLARLLGVSVPTAVGHLHLLWHWCLDFADDGDVSDFGWDDIADAAMWEGDAATFGQALVACGWIDAADDDPPAHTIHDWDEFTGRLQQSREANRERQKRYRERHKDEGNEGVTADNALRNGDVTVNNALTVPNLTVPNSTVPNRTGEKPSRVRATPPTEPPERVPEKRPLMARLIERGVVLPRVTSKTQWKQHWAAVDEFERLGLSVEQLDHAIATARDSLARWKNGDAPTLTPKWLMDHLSDYFTEPPTPVPRIEDIKSPMMQAIATYERDFDDSDDDLSAQNGRPRGLFAAPRRLATGES
jgi:hypothetical protein